MTLVEAIVAADSKAIITAVQAGARVGPAELAVALQKEAHVLKLLLELKAVPLTAEDNVLHRVGEAIRAAYPDAARKKRAKNPTFSEPLAIQELRRKAAMLIEAGAIVDFEAAVRLGLGERVEAMLLADPSLGKKRLAGALPAEVAAWGGSWELARLFKTSAKAGAVFDWAGAQQAVLQWASEAMVAFGAAQKRESFRRLALEFDGRGKVALSADSTDGNASSPATYSHRAFAQLSDTEEGAALAKALTEHPERCLVMLGQLALQLEASAAAKAMKRGMRFTVLAFGRNEDEAAALLRQKLAKRAAGG